MSIFHPYRMVDGPDPVQTHAIDLRVSLVLNELERNGSLIDVERAEDLGLYLDAVMEETAELTQDAAGYRFNVSSDEDFSYVLNEIPGTMMFLGGTEPERDASKAPANHSNLVTFDEAAMPHGVELYAQMALRHLGAV